MSCVWDKLLVFDRFLANFLYMSIFNSARSCSNVSSDIIKRLWYSRINGAWWYCGFQATMVHEKCFCHHSIMQSNVYS